MRRFALAVTLIVVGLASCSGGNDAPSPLAEVRASNEPLLGITWGPRVSWGFSGGRVRRFDPRSLEPLPGARLRLGEHGFSWAFSADGSTIALGGSSGRLRVIDAATLRPVAETRLDRPRGLIVGLVWTTPRHILALVQGVAVLRAVGVDPRTGDITRDRRLPFRFRFEGVTSVEPIGDDALAALVRPWTKLGPPRIVVVRANGTATEIVLDELAVGSTRAGPGTPVGRQSEPGFAVDPESGRGFVVAGGEPVAEVDLRSGRVVYHALVRPVALLERVRNWLEPEAHAKAQEGPVRHAAWVADGILALSGTDISVTETRSGPHRFVEWDEHPAGLHLIDTADWTVRTVDGNVSRFVVSDGRVVAFGGDRDDGERRGIGVSAYTRDGTLLWRRFAGERVFTAQAAQGRVYVELMRGRKRELAVLDLATGRVVARRTVRGFLPVFVVPELVNRYG